MAPTDGPEHDHDHEHGRGSPFAAFASLFAQGSPFVPGNGPECMACPFCLLLYGIRQARPDVMEHVMKASMEMVLAMKAVVDAAAERQGETGSLRRIPIA